VIVVEGGGASVGQCVVLRVEQLLLQSDTACFVVVCCCCRVIPRVLLVLQLDTACFVVVLTSQCMNCLVEWVD